jgi:hypothetical protein
MLARLRWLISRPRAACRSRGDGGVTLHGYAWCKAGKPGDAGADGAGGGEGGSLGQVLSGGLETPKFPFGNVVRLG